MSIPLILRDEPFTTPTPIELPEGVATVSEFAEAVTMADLPSIFDAAFRALAQANPVGPGYALYSGPPHGTFDLEVGFPINQAPPASYTTGTFPTGKALALTHVGAYDGLRDSWQRLSDAYGELELGPVRLIAEIYTTDPSVTPPAELRTDLLLLY